MNNQPQRIFICLQCLMVNSVNVRIIVYIKLADLWMDNIVSE